MLIRKGKLMTRGYLEDQGEDRGEGKGKAKGKGKIVPVL
jgi:hypothetical protein